MKTLYPLAAVALLLGYTACNDDLDEAVASANIQSTETLIPSSTRAVSQQSSSFDITDISGSVFTLDTTLTIATKPTAFNVESYKSPFKVEAQSAQNVDLHLSVLPLYAFGDKFYSGDYYAVEGYIIAHNHDLYTTREASKPCEGETLHGKLYAYFMGDLGFDLQLLDDQENAVNHDAVCFYNEPEPSTTIGSTTYVKGFTFAINAALSFGYSSVCGPYINVTVLPKFSWNDSSTQNLPDQTVSMQTGSDCSVHYDFLTKNYSCNGEGNVIPGMAVNDQRVDFSFVWHVKFGNYAAKDFDSGHMKLRFNFRPQLLANGTFEDSFLEGGKAVMDYSKGSFIIDLPATDRTPIGSLKVSNPYNYYLTDISIWRSGEYGKAGTQPIKSTTDAFWADDSYETILRSGDYDFVFNMRDAETGGIKYERIIRGIHIGGGDNVVANLSRSEKR